MNIIVRTETVGDFGQVFELTEKAFADMQISDHTEQFLVERLRKSDSFIPGLSVVAEYENKVIGHILLSRIHIIGEVNKVESLILAPVSVLPRYQRSGIGTKLINEAHRRATELGFTSVVLVGHPEYYPRFGYKLLSTYSIRFGFPVPDECCMGKELVPEALTNCAGLIELPQEFLPA